MNGLGDVDDEFLSALRDMSENCVVCKRFKPSMPKPAVGSLLDPETAKFNEMVTADLKVRNGKLIFEEITPCYDHHIQSNNVLNAEKE